MSRACLVNPLISAVVLMGMATRTATAQSGPQVTPETRIPVDAARLMVAVWELLPSVAVTVAV